MANLRFYFLGVCLALCAPALRSESIVARIDGYPVTVSELRLFISWNRALVAGECFADRPAVSEAMWQEKRGRTSAAELLRSKALSAALLAKARQILFLEHGFIPSVDFSRIQSDWELENRTRATDAAQGLPVYGPLNWRFGAYYRQREALLMLKLAGALAPQLPPPSPAEVRQYAAAQEMALRRPVNDPDSRPIHRSAEDEIRILLIKQHSEAAAAALPQKRLNAAHVEVDAKRLAAVPLN